MTPIRTLWLGAAFAAIAAGQTNPLLSENKVTRVSEHVYAIEGWPNVGIIVGDHATLVVDTGMGPRNGATVAHLRLQVSPRSGRFGGCRGVCRWIWGGFISKVA